jgi:hypothetical protein
MKLSVITCSLFALLAQSLAAQTPPPPPVQPVPVTNKEQDKPAQEKKEEPKVLELGKTLGRAVQLPDIDGKVLDSRTLRDKIVVVNFWSTRCPIMQGWEERYAAIHREYSEKGIAFVTINSNAANGELSKDEVQGRVSVEPTEAEAKKPYPEIRAYLRGNELPYRVLVDADCAVADLFDAKSTPHIFVFDTSGKLVYKGLIDDDLRQRKGDKAKHHLRDVLDTLLDDDATLEPYQTKEQGCGIKRPKKEKPARRGGGGE